MSLEPSACVTYPIKTVPLDENGKQISQKGQQIRTDLVYYLPKSMIKATFQGGDQPTVELTSLAIADRSAGFAIERPRRFGGRGTVALATKSSGESGKSTHVGLLSTAALTSEDGQVSSNNEIRNFTNALVSFSDSLKAPKDTGKASAPEAGPGVNPDLNTIRHQIMSVSATEAVSREVLCGASRQGKFHNLIFTETNTSVNGKYGDCTFVVGDYKVTIRPISDLHKSWLSTPLKDESYSSDPCLAAFGSDRRNSQLCYRQRLSAPFAVCLEKKPSELKASVNMVGDAFCQRGAQTIQFVEVYDRSQNYSVSLNGQQFVKVNSTLKFEDGTLIGIDDTRPGVIKSVSQAPFAFGADVVNSLGLLVAAVFIN